MINTKSGFLRAVSPEDTERYQSWINDPETNYWRGLYPPTSAEGALTWIKEQATPTSDQITFGICAKELVGFIGLRKICSRSRRAEIWIYLGDKSVWSQGIGKDAIRALCYYAFNEMNLFRIWLECDAAHVAAKKCYEKAGFQHEGTLRQAYYRRGEYRDTCIFGLLRTDAWNLL